MLLLLTLCCSLSLSFSNFTVPLISLQIYQLSLFSVSLSNHPTPFPFILTDVEADASSLQKESISDIKRPNEWEPPVCVPAAK